MKLTRFKAGMKAAIKDVIKDTENNDCPFSCISIDDRLGLTDCLPRESYNKFIDSSGLIRENGITLRDYFLGNENLLFLRVFLMKSFEIEVINSGEYLKWN